jgi:hypothetical protein
MRTFFFGTIKHNLPEDRLRLEGGTWNQDGRGDMQLVTPVGVCSMCMHTGGAKFSPDRLVAELTCNT